MLHFTPITRTELMAAQDLLSTKARQWGYQNLDYLNKPLNLLGSSTKVEKGHEKRETYIVYLQPANKVSKATLCIGAQASGCEKPCLISSGHLGMSAGQRKATKRTILLLLRPEWFNDKLLSEIDRAEKRALKTGIPALFRLNGTSDLDWTHIISARPFSAFYDYTKVLSRVRKNTLSNYHLTFSGSMYSNQSKQALKKALSAQFNTVVAYNTKGIKSDNVVRPVGLVDMDKTDLRPLDPKGSLGTLSRKGSNKIQRAQEGYASFFITKANIGEFHDIIASSL